jgi:redox-sensing transcriptional repressor
MTSISESTIRRLSHYYRTLQEVEAEGGRTISSRRLAERGGITPAQVRKDLSYFGSFGRRGLGYNVHYLREEICGILGLDRRWRVAVVGAGRIGTALYSYEGFAKQGFDVVAVFDADPGRIGQRYGDLVIQDVARLSDLASQLEIEIGVVATPPGSAQAVADRLVAAGVRGIVNFAPRKLFVPPDVTLRTVDMAVELESLAFALVHARGARNARRSRTRRAPAAE